MPGFGQSEHMAVPPWLVFVRIAQGALAVLILILTAVAANKLLGGLDTHYLLEIFPSYGFAWFAVAWTIVYIPLSIFVIPRFGANLKPFVIVLVLDSFSTLWWLVGFALLADDSRKLDLALSAVDYVYGSDSLESNSADVPISLTKASAGIGALEFLLFAGSLALVSLAFLKQKKHTVTRSEAPNTTVNNTIPDAEAQTVHSSELPSKPYP